MVVVTISATSIPFGFQERHSNHAIAGWQRRSLRRGIHGLRVGHQTEGVDRFQALVGIEGQDRSDPQPGELLWMGDRIAVGQVSFLDLVESSMDSRV